LELAEVAFVWCASQLKDNEIETWSIENEKFSFNPYLDHLRKHARQGPPLLTSAKVVKIVREDTYSQVYRVLLGAGQIKPAVQKYPKLAEHFTRVVAEININTGECSRSALYCYLCIDKKAGLEVLVQGGTSLSCMLRSITGNIAKDQTNAFHHLSHGA
jgi:hypothetical protein